MTIVTLFVLVFLAVMWAAVLAAPVLLNRSRGGRSGDTVKTFQQQLALLGRSNVRPTSLIPPLGKPRPAMHASPRNVSGSQLAAQRRRRVFFALVGAVVLTMFGAWMIGGLFIPLQLLADVLLVAYIGMAVRIVRVAAEREMKVAFLPHRNPGAEPTQLLREVAQSRR